MADNFKWFKQYPSRFLRGVRGLGPDVIGCYSVVLNAIYEDEKSCPNDAHWIGGILGCSTRKAAALIQTLLDKGKLRLNADGNLINDTAEIELENRAETHRIARESGAKGGRVSAEKRSGRKKNNSLVQGSLKHLEENREEKNKSSIPGSTNPGDAVEKRKVKIPDGFPHDAAKKAAADFWAKKGRHDLAASVEDQAAQFRDHHTSRGNKMLDWGAAWRTWIRNALEFSRPKNPPAVISRGQTNSEAGVTMALWVRRLRAFWEGDEDWIVDPGYWQKAWGPSPKEKGCLAPPEALRAYRAGSGGAGAAQ